MEWHIHGQILLLSPEDKDLIPRLELWTRKNRTEVHLASARKTKKGRRYRSRRIRPFYRLVMRRMLGNKRIPRGMHVDHINRNPLDNRRENLRLTTPQQNAANRSVSGRGTSKYKGVSLTPSGKWKAALSLTIHPRTRYRAYKKATINLGVFSQEEDAARAYDTTAREWFGSFACTNF